MLALGASTAALAAALWLLRFPIAAFFIGAALADRGVEADFEIVNLDFDHAVLSSVRFGSETSPDAAIPTAEARWTWSGLSPRLRALTLTSPRLRLRVDPAGRVSAGVLDNLGSGGPGRRRPSLPAIDLAITDGEALIEAPFGALTATFEASGTLGDDFTGAARIAETSRPGRTHALDRGSADLVVVSRDEAIAARLTANVRGLIWDGAALDGGYVRLTARAPLDLSRYAGEVAWRAEAVHSPDISAARLNGAVGAEAVARDDSIEPQAWEAQARANFGSLTLASNTMERARFEFRADGRDARGQGRWTLGADRFDGLAMISNQPSASGHITFELRGDETMHGEAQVALMQARLSDQAQQRLRATFPDLPTAPIGPTFARAEHALDAAADRFNLALPLTLEADESGFHIRVAAPAEARAASGAVLRLSPLRNDAPAIVAQWPGANVHGAVLLELSGGGTPSATLLLDTLDWSPGEPFEADGTLTLADWRADGASIATDELSVGIAVSPRGEGRVDLRGPVRVTGPLGDGEVRDMVAGLDIAALWNPGWRVVSERGCLPIQLGGLDAAGLSFANGAFSLCPLDGALIAADASQNLSGGFNIRGLGLNGRMAGPDAQPARLSAANVTGRFRGRTGDVTLALQADTPGLQIEMAEERTLAIAMQRATADAHIANNTWRVDGAFEQGSLRDPTLPGTVSTIAGHWGAAPEDNKPVIRVVAGEALLTAAAPASEEERTLFNPMRLINVDAIFRDGRIDATGAIQLEETARQLAQFTAHHDVDEGVGAAQVVAPSLTFDETLQPYNITERARGTVDNVRGPASATADVVWTRDGLNATGVLRAEGVSMATATMPVIQNVRGDIHFDDLFNLTTPPGQVVTVGMLNPGLVVTDGRVQFQLLTEQRVAIERAEFVFAGGVLAMAPTTVRLGEDETRIELTLRDVDAAGLIDNLGIPDLAATGRVQGSFPLRLNRQSAYIEGGVLEAQGEGGVIAYTGNAGGDSTGPARIAFDALRQFRYDALRLTLDGDLNGDVVSSIEFSGRNAGDAVDLGEIAPVPGLGRVTVRGVPFDFNVRVTAPFRSLAQTAASITDPSVIINRANGANTPEDEEQQPEAVDQGAPGTR